MGLMMKGLQRPSSLLMSDILMSEAYLPLIKGDKRFEILSEPAPMQFDAQGRLARLPRPH